MAKNRKKVPNSVRRQLLRESAGKCANPGCSAIAVHLHHIKMWYVYETHNADEMIALCPNCHDQVHRGDLTIDDETLYRWKGVTRSSSPSGGHLYVEPSSDPSLELGSVRIIAQEGLLIFRLSPQIDLSFLVLDRDIVSLNLTIQDTSGKQVVRIRNNHIEPVTDKAISVLQRTGLLRVSVPWTIAYVPDWFTERIPAHGDRIDLLEVEVVAPGIARVMGLWSSDDRAVHINKDSISIYESSSDRGWRIMNGTIVVKDPEIIKSLFSFDRTGTSAFCLNGHSNEYGDK